MRCVILFLCLGACQLNYLPNCTHECDQGLSDQNIGGAVP